MNSEVLDGLAVYRIGYSKAVSLKVSKDLHDRTNKSWEKLTNSGFFNR
jgi:hypothetical protein